MYSRADLITLTDQAAANYNIPQNLFEAQIQRESQYNPDAKGLAGEQGLAQIMPYNFTALGISNGYDPVQSLNGGAMLMAQLYKKLGDWREALRAYNAGEAGAKRNPKAGAGYADTILNNARAIPIKDESGKPVTNTNSAPSFFTSPIENIQYYFKQSIWYLAGIALVLVLMYFGLQQLIKE